MECRNSALCVFDKQAVQTDVLKSTVVEYHPINTLTGDAPIDFEVPGSGDDYIDLNDINLRLTVQITKGDGTNLAAADKVALVNLGIASLFSDVAVKVGDTQVQGGEFNYPYIAYFQTAVQFQKQAQKTHLKLWGWERDDGGKFDDDSNSGFVSRLRHVKESKLYELHGPLFIGIFRQNRYLIPKTPLRIQLKRALSKFALLATAAGDYKVNIHKARLYVRRVTVNPSVIEGHNVGLQKRNAIYPYLHPQLVIHTAMKDTLETHRENLFPDAMPRALIIAMVEHVAYTGNILKNPFNFKNFDLRRLVLYHNGEIVQGQVFEPHYKEDKYSDVYAQTMSALKMYNTDDSNGITYDDFKEGYNFYAFDLTPDGGANDAHRTVSLDTGLRLEMKFGTKLASNVNILIFGLFDEFMEITKLRHVMTSVNK